MRLIKLRVWDKTQKLMLYYDKDVVPLLTLNGVLVDAGMTGHSTNVSYRFDLMQFTGLKDKNGKEDWIDDIVKTKIGGFIYHRRIFQAESGAFCINLPVIGATGGEDAIMLITCEHENVGNVHENPQLLEEKK